MEDGKKFSKETIKKETRPPGRYHQEGAESMALRFKNITRHTSLCLCFLLLAGCSGYCIIPRHTVPGVPDTGYERLIKLYNPEGLPENSLAGIVHITGKATVCTDYPRQETINSLDDLSLMEKLAYPYLRVYAVEDGEVIFGYVSVSIDYRVNIWRNENAPDCRYKIQIVMPERSFGSPERDGVDQSITSW